MARLGKRGLVVGAVIGVAFVSGAAVLGARGIEGGREADKARAINQALNGGPRSDWAAAAAAARRYARDPADGDAEVGALLLRSLADPRPASRPSGTAEDAYRLMEAGASRDPGHNAPILESFLRYGVAEPRSERLVIAPETAVAECWSRVVTHTEQATTCVALRREARGRPS